MIKTLPGIWQGFPYEYIKYIIQYNYIYITCEVAFDCPAKRVSFAWMALVEEKPGQSAHEASSLITYPSEKQNAWKVAKNGKQSYSPCGSLQNGVEQLVREGSVMLIICPIRYGWRGQNGPGHYTIRETVVLRIVETGNFVRSGAIRLPNCTCPGKNEAKKRDEKRIVTCL